MNPAANIEPKLDRRKLLSVVHYVCSQCAAEELGNVKLHKILYFSDMLHYVSTGEALTGVEYRKQKFGPVAKHLSWATEQLARDGKIKIQLRDYFGFQKIDYICQSQPNKNELTNSQVQLIADVIDFVCARSAKEISDLSHNSAWKAAKMGEVIPYFSAFGMFPAQLSEADIRAAKIEAQRIRPEIEEEKHARGIF